MKPIEDNISVNYNIIDYMNKTLYYVSYKIICFYNTYKKKAISVLDYIDVSKIRRFLLLNVNNISVHRAQFIILIGLSVLMLELFYSKKSYKRNRGSQIRKDIEIASDLDELYNLSKIFAEYIKDYIKNTSQYLIIYINEIFSDENMNMGCLSQDEKRIQKIIDNIPKILMNTDFLNKFNKNVS